MIKTLKCLAKSYTVIKKWDYIKQLYTCLIIFNIKKINEVLKLKLRVKKLVIRKINIKIFFIIFFIIFISK